MESDRLLYTLAKIADSITAINDTQKKMREYYDARIEYLIVRIERLEQELIERKTIGGESDAA